MPRKHLVSLDLSQNEIQNAVAQVLASAPSTPKTGQFYFNSTTDRLLVRSAASWVDYTARSSHSGTQTASTISDLAATVQAYRLDQFAAPTSAVSINSQRLTNVATPTAGTDGVNRDYVDLAVQSAAASIDNKASVRVVSVSNVATLSGLSAIDSVTLVAGDRVLLTGQTTASQNGVYVAAAGAWSRATDADANGELTPGAFWYVEEGTLYGKTQWRCTNVGAINIGTTSIVINQWGAAADLTPGNGIQATGNVWAVRPSTGISVSALGVAVDTSVVARKFATTIGDGSATSFTITHNLNSQDVITHVREVATNNKVEVDIQNNGVNTVVVSFVNPPAASSYRVVVIG
jgi:hypothetical protein